MSETVSSLLDAASAGADEAIRHLAELAGDRSMCAIGRSGESFPAAKYHEGRWAALAEAARHLRRDAARADVEQLLVSWRDRRDASASGDWRAYWSGGADALAELLAVDDERRPP